MESRLSVTFSLLAADPVSAGGKGVGPQVSHQPGREKSHLQGAGGTKGKHPHPQQTGAPLLCLTGRLELTKGPVTLTAKRRVSLEGIRGVLGIPCNKRATIQLGNRGSCIRYYQPNQRGALRMIAHPSASDLRAYPDGSGFSPSTGSKRSGGRGY